MIYVASSIEEMKAGWREFDLAICKNLVRTFGITRYFLIAESQHNLDWAHRQDFDGDIAVVRSLSDVYKTLGEKVHFVNVQPREVFRKLNMRFDWLDDYDHHPGDTCYVFGSNQQSITVGAGDAIAIPLVSSSLFSFCAAAIILHDRTSKLDGERCSSIGRSVRF